MFAIRHVVAGIVFCGLALALGAGGLGCRSSGEEQKDPAQAKPSSGQASARANRSGGETAPQAWERLHSQGALGDISEALGQPTLKKLLKQAEIDANTQAAVAMRTSLPIDALDAMIDDVAQRMEKTVSDAPEVKSSPNQLILAFATIGDATGSRNSHLVEALDSLRSRLFHSDEMKKNFVFVSTTEKDAKTLSDKIAGGDTSMFRDPLQRTPDNTRTVVYDPAAIFVITGSLHSEKEAVNHSVRITLSLEFNHVQSRRMVANEEFIRTYMWHPTEKKWELQPG